MGGFEDEEAASCFGKLCTKLEDSAENNYGLVYSFKSKSLVKINSLEILSRCSFM